MNMRNLLFVTVCLLAAAAVAAFSAGWTAAVSETNNEPKASGSFELDSVHSTVIFNIRHLNVAPFYGRFNIITGTVDWDDDNPATGRFSLRVDATSVDTANDRRDAHLRSPDFFNTNEFPQITFTSTNIERAGDGYRVSGDLNMHGVTKPITMNLKRTGVTSRRGNTVVGFEANGIIKRSDFNMTYGIDGGMLGDEVRLMIGLEAVKQ